LKTRLPVRSALFKQRTGGLVVRWVTTGESPLLYVFAAFRFFLFLARLDVGAGFYAESVMRGGLRFEVVDQLRF
jgi:hypothetical protein